MNKELAKVAGMKENVSLITDGCDNMLSKVQDEDDDDYQRWNRPSFHIIHVQCKFLGSLPGTCSVSRQSEISQSGEPQVSHRHELTCTNLYS